MRTRAFTTVGWEKYLVPTNPFVQNFLNKNGDDVLWQVAQNIHNAILDGKENVGVKKEIYEKCALIQTYKSDFKNKSSRKKLDDSKKQKNVI